jgi:hypothetical protein
MERGGAGRLQPGRAFYGQDLEGLPCRWDLGPLLLHCSQPPSLREGGVQECLVREKKRAKDLEIPQATFFSWNFKL